MRDPPFREILFYIPPVAANAITGGRKSVFFSLRMQGEQAMSAGAPGAPAGRVGPMPSSTRLFLRFVDRLYIAALGGNHS